MTIFDKVKALGYRETSNQDSHARYKRYNCEITIQYGEKENFNLYCEIKKKDYYAEFNRHNILQQDADRVLKQMNNFIKLISKGRI